MKFRLSTLLWVCAFITVLLGAVVTIQRERAKALERQQQSMQQLQLAHRDVQKAEDELKILESMAKSAFKAAGHFTDSKPGPRIKSVKARYEIPNIGKPPLVWSWRIVQPEKNKTFELCWTTKLIPDENRIPTENVKKYEVVFSQSTTDARTNVTTNRYLGDTLIRFSIDHHNGSVDIDVQSYVSQAWPKPITSLFNLNCYMDGLHIHMNDRGLDWIKEYVPHGDKTTIENENVFAGEQNLSYNQPLELVKIRGKKKQGDKFESVDGASPGLMIWLREKKE